MPDMQALGRHFLIELYACKTEILNDLSVVEHTLLDAARSAGATVLGHQFHRFTPHGVSGMVIIAESHLSIHTWPEHHYAAVDLFTCGDTMQPTKAIDLLQRAFCPEAVEVVELLRGEKATTFPQSSH